LVENKFSYPQNFENKYSDQTKSASPSESNGCPLIALTRTAIGLTTFKKKKFKDYVFLYFI